MIRLAKGCEDLGITINALPVEKGDCIHIRFNDDTGYHNIVIDSGGEKTYKVFFNLLLHIKSIGETLDVLCFTHIDDDHIAGAKKAFAQHHADWSFIKTVWFNHTASSDKSRYTFRSKSFHTLSAKSADELIGYLKYHHLNIISGIMQGYNTMIGQSELFVLTPIQKRMRASANTTRPFLTLAFHADSSKTNALSIAFLLEYNHEQFLFCGDAFASDLTKALKEYASKKSIYCAKLSHHGSARNLTPKLLEQMGTLRFIISSNGSVQFPSDGTIQMLENYKPESRKHLLCNFQLKRKIHNPAKLKAVNLTLSPYKDSGITIMSKEVKP